MTQRRLLRLGVIGALMLSLVACSGLPTSGGVHAGLSPDETDTQTDVTILARGPSPGATPEEIVAGFIEAGVSPLNRWATARQFLSRDLAASWSPEEGVSIDRSGVSRTLISDTDDPEAKTVRVQATITPVASVDAAGSYTESTGGTAEAPYELERNEDGEWRIVSAPNGIILDEDYFRLVFDRYSLQYFDPSWEHLVPDPRWFPVRSTIAATITQAVVSGQPSAWLAGAVISAFPEEVSLAHTSVLVTEQIAEVALTSAALSLDPLVLARMRTQLERSLADTDVREVRFTVNGQELPTDLAETVSNRIDSNAIVLTDQAFGPFTGGDVVDLPGLSAPILQIEEPISAIEVSGDSLRAAVQLASGPVLWVADDAVQLLDDRAGLIAPVLDPRGFVWTVPQDAPLELLAWAPNAAEEPSEEAEAEADAEAETGGSALPVMATWTDATRISHLRIAPDGARIAATMTIGAQEWVGLAGIIRDAEGAPVELGPFELLSRLPGAGLGLVWLGEDAVAVLTVDGETPQVIERSIGGPATSSIVPTETVAIAGASAGVRLLDRFGVVSIKRGASWEKSVTDVRVLATQSGR